MAVGLQWLGGAAMAVGQPSLRAPRCGRSPVGAVAARAASPSPSPWQLLQVAIGLEAMVAGVGHHHVSVGGEGQALRPVQGVGGRVDVGEEGARAVEDLRGQADALSLTSPLPLLPCHPTSPGNPCHPDGLWHAGTLSPLC